MCVCIKNFSTTLDKSLRKNNWKKGDGETGKHKINESTECETEKSETN